MIRNMSSCLLGVVFIISICLLSGVNADKTAIFNLVEFIVELWKNFCKRLKETFKCYLDNIDPTLGGQGHTCTGAIFDLETFILEIWSNLYNRLADTWKCLLLVLPENLGGKTTPCYNSTSQ
ncbi:unnamed protein product [Schistosoma rodhaini]|uniref:Uncharacterized protein n=1 Tax=Schistosoma rodhaini TaxID=6188 RepID=A0AA85GBL9_9TREM|nr:unnamed protein product [Schistosoma rodhaini]